MSNEINCILKAAEVFTVSCVKRTLIVQVIKQGMVNFIQNFKKKSERSLMGVGRNK